MEPMTIRQYEETDYQDLVHWWQARKDWQPINKELLPQCGVIVEQADKKLAALFVYQDNTTPFAMLEWIVTNPDNTARESIVSLRVGIDYVMQAMKKVGRGALFTTSSNPALIRLLEKHGFEQTDTNVTHLCYVEPQPEEI